MDLARPHWRKHFAFIVAPAAQGVVTVPNAIWNIGQFGDGAAFYAVMNYTCFDPAAPQVNNSSAEHVRAGVIVAGALATTGQVDGLVTSNGVPVSINFANSTVVGRTVGWLGIELLNIGGGNVLQHACIDVSIAICGADEFEPTVVVGGG